MSHCTTLIVELETRETHVEHFNSKNKKLIQKDVNKPKKFPFFNIIY